MGLPADRKYQRRADGPPSFATFAALLDEWGTDPLLDKRSLLQLVTFAVLTGNADLHAKNISLIGHPLVRLAPIYDVVNTAAYAGVDLELGLRIGQAIDIEDVTVAELITEAGKWGLGDKAALVAIRLVAERALSEVDRVLADAAHQGFAHEKVDLTAMRVRRRAEALIRWRPAP
jgi:serine/threonine-protein kinase HipA